MNDKPARNSVPFQELIEDTSRLSQSVELRDELLASIAISLKRLADMFDDWRRK